jgi:hypothetical protein
LVLVVHLKKRACLGAAIEPALPSRDDRARRRKRFDDRESKALEAGPMREDGAGDECVKLVLSKHRSGEVDVSLEPKGARLGQQRVASPAVRANDDEVEIETASTRV